MARWRGRRRHCHSAPGAPCHSGVLARLFCEKTAVPEVGGSPPWVQLLLPREAGGARRQLCRRLGFAPPWGQLGRSRHFRAPPRSSRFFPLDGRCDAAAGSGVGFCTSVGPAPTASGGRRGASAAVPEVGACTSVGSASSVRALPAASSQYSSSSLGGRCEAAAVPEVGVGTSVGSASMVRACPAAAQI